MSVPLEKIHYSVAEYLDQERASDIRHEYHDGEILAMACGSVRHSRIASNALIAIGLALRGKPCQPHGSDLKVSIRSQSRFVYPDITIVCGEPQIDPRAEQSEAITNPTAVIEVLSPSTQTYDRTKKFQYYRALDSLQEYVLIASDEARIETFCRRDDGSWAFRSWTGLEAQVPIESVSITVHAAEVYAGVEFDSPPPVPTDRHDEQSQ
jgi:Uma2 family endonuclease